MSSFSVKACSYEDRAAKYETKEPSLPASRSQHQTSQLLAAVANALTFRKMKGKCCH